MKTGEMNTDLEYNGYIKHELDALGSGITISKAQGTWTIQH